MRLFRTSSQSFPNPYNVRCGKIVLPQLLDSYTIFTRKLIKEMDDNLGHLNGEFLHSYVTDTGIPDILNERRNELNVGEIFTTIDLLNENRLIKVSIPPIYR